MITPDQFRVNEAWIAVRINEDFFNTSDEHAQIVLTAMMHYAKKEVNIYCGNLCTDVSNNPDYLNEIKSFVDDRNGSIKIILCDYKEDLKKKPIYEQFKDHNKVVFKKTNSRLIYNRKPVHFTIVDQLAYRLETDIKKKIARGNFNDPQAAASLHNYFEALDKKSTEI